VTRPRAADDFAVIRARIEELRRERTRPRAADDFAVIHARLLELRRERERVQARAGHASARSTTPGPRASAAGKGAAPE
jgi:hypothetical protein